MKSGLRERLNIRKASRFAIFINALQVFAMLAVLVYVLLSRQTPDRNIEIALLFLALIIIVWGAVLDIREARGAVKIAEQAQMLEEAYAQLEALNGTLRKERHDFKNHLQVVYSLMEMDDAAEAMAYIDSLYADLQRSGSALKTAIPAVNALIAAKRHECDERGIAFDTDMASPWQGMPLPGWEMCRVLSNLIDNARDALTGQKGNPSPRILLSIGETPAAFTFSVSNNGPAIPPSHRESIFQMGFTTKDDGHGSGLSIVRDILTQAGGSIDVESDEYETVFSGSIPRQNKTDAA